MSPAETKNASVLTGSMVDPEAVGWEDVNVEGNQDQPEEEGVEQEAAPAPMKPESFKMNIGGKDVEVENRMVPLIGQLASALVLLIAITVRGEVVDNFAYGVSMAVISMVFSMAGIYMMYKNVDGSLGNFPFLGDLTYSGANNLFLFLWWMIGVGILTFNGPFLETSNGYFASWAGFFFAVAGFTDIENLKSQAQGVEGYKNLLLVASVVLLCALPSETGGGVFNPNSGSVIFALVIVIITALLVLAVKFSPETAAATKKVPVWELMAVLWMVFACLLTFRGPFLTTGNGYFGAWGGFLSCVMVAAQDRMADGTDTAPHIDAPKEEEENIEKRDEEEEEEENN